MIHSLEKPSKQQRESLAVQMYREGVKVEIIIMMTQLSGGAIRALANAQGVKGRREVTAERNKKAVSMLRKGVKLQAVAREFEMDVAFLYRIAKREGLIDTKEGKRIAETASAFNAEFAAEVYGVSQSYVGECIKKAAI